ncbi:hypothetical protein [Alkalihalobacillus deserti]|uniref:hypothetical protein n=1 Tax=Alkalihalobacillus deserti TaxID=2879466 RepID=UPI001D1533CC|nr:hypothetical protein [Alkalihalobacillus deserti]
MKEVYDILFGTLLPLLKIVLSFLYPLLLLIGCIVCWKRSFKVGIIFFLLMISNEIFLFYGMNYFIQFPSIVTSFSKILLSAAFLILIVGLYRRKKFD